MDATRVPKKYYTKLSELKERVIEVLQDILDNGEAKEKKEVALVCVKSRIFDESTNITNKGPVEISIREHGDSNVQSKPVAEDSSSG